MPSGCNRAKDLRPFSQRGGSNPWNELLSKFAWKESIQTLQALRSGWHTAENTSPDTNLSGPSSSSSHSLTAITVSWPTFTSSAIAACVQSSSWSHRAPPSTHCVFALLTIKRNCRDVRFSRLSGDKLRRNSRAVTGPFLLCCHVARARLISSVQREAKSNQTATKETRFSV